MTERKTYLVPAWFEVEAGSPETALQTVHEALASTQVFHEAPFVDRVYPAINEVLPAIAKDRR